MSKNIQNIINQELDKPIRGSVSFVPKKLLLERWISEKIWKQLEWTVSTCMKESYQNHVTQKTSQDILTISRDLIYIDASKKWDFDIFTYMTKIYFNQLSEEVRIQYNKFILRTFDARDKNIIGDIQIDQIWWTDILFEKEIEIFKSYTEARKNDWSDIMIDLVPMNKISMLMRINETQDINIFLDNISNISQKEKKYINTLIRWWLLMESESWAGLFINNGTGKRDYWIVAGNHPPQDGHDMTLIYL